MNLIILNERGLPVTPKRNEKYFVKPTGEVVVLQFEDPGVRMYTVKNYSWKLSQQAEKEYATYAGLKVFLKTFDPHEPKDSWYTNHFEMMEQLINDFKQFITRSNGNRTNKRKEG